jgi:two-component system, cell cycle sensor histidine kinase and response regulator CckA
VHPRGVFFARMSIQQEHGEQQILRLFVEHAPAAISMFDRQMRYIAASRRWKEDYHLGDTQIVGRSHYDVFPEIPERWKELHRRGLKGEVLRSDGDEVFERSGGKQQWLTWEIRPWPEADGSVGGILIFSEETSLRRAHTSALEANAELERRVAQRTAELQQALTNQRVLFQTSPTALALCEMDGKLIEVNPAFLRIIGYSEAEARDLNYWDITPRAFAEQETAQLEQLRKTGRYGPYIKEYRHKDGHRVPVRLTGLLIERGSQQYIWSSVEDITEERERQRASALARAIVDQSEDAVISKALDGTVLTWNPGAEAVFGFSAAETWQIG